MRNSVLATLLVAAVSTGGIVTGTSPTDAAETTTALDRVVKDARIKSASGLTRSTYARSLLWTHNNSGDKPRIFAVTKKGAVRSVVHLKGADHVDYEDIAAGRGHQLWVGDIGDNAWNRRAVQVYKVKEPAGRKAAKALPAKRFTFKYADGPRNAEALMVNPVTGRLFVVSHQHKGAGIYTTTADLSKRTTNVLSRVADAPADVTAGAYLRSGKGYVLVNDSNVLVYRADGAFVASLPKPAVGPGASVTTSRNGAWILLGSEGAKSAVYRMPMPPLTAATTTPDQPKPPVAPTPPPSPSPAPSPVPAGGAPLLGQYSGNPGENPDQKFISSFGVAPELTASYYTTQAVNVAYETARVGRGTSVFMDLDSKNTPGLIGEVANRTTTGMAYIDNFLKSAEKVAAARADDGTVYVAYVHEWEVKRAQNVLKNTQDRDPLVYAKAHSVFNQRAAQIAPHVVPGYWIGGFSTNQAVVSQVMANMTTAPSFLATDPYENNNTKATAVGTWLPKGVTFFKQHANYQKWGKPAIFLTEFGISTTLGDAAAASFLTDLRGSMAKAGIAGAIHFNRDKTDQGSGLAVRYKIDNGTTPGALKAFKNSLLR